jgi:hypothetical protein
MTRGWLLVLIVALVGCRSRDEARRTAGAPPIVTQGRAVPDAMDACARIVVDLHRELATLPARCTRDQDCACYVGGVSGVTNCGGVSDLAISGRVAVLTQAFQQARCTPSMACAARLCTATCRAGVCAE